MLFIDNESMINLMMSYCGYTLFAFYTVFDVKAMLCEMNHVLREDDIVLATYLLYLDPLVYVLKFFAYFVSVK